MVSAIQIFLNAENSNVFMTKTEHFSNQRHRPQNRLTSAPCHATFEQKGLYSFLLFFQSFLDDLPFPFCSFCFPIFCCLLSFYAFSFICTLLVTSCLARGHICSSVSVHSGNTLLKSFTWSPIPPHCGLAHLTDCIEWVASH